MRFQSLTLSTIQGGAHSGAAAFFLQVGDGRKHLALSELVNEIAEMRTSMQLYVCGLVIHEPEDAQQDVELNQLALTVRDQGVTPIAYVTGKARPAYYDSCAWHRVQRDVGNPNDWMQFNAEEYELLCTANLPTNEPHFHKNNQNIDRMLTLSKRIKPQDVLTTISQFQGAWRVNYPAIKTLEVEVA